MQMFRMKYVLLLSIFFVASLCEDRPKIITRITSQVVLNTGDNATLTCYVDNPDEYVVAWVKEDRDSPRGQFVLSIGNRIAVKDPRFTVTATSDSVTLQIRNVKHSDAAVYQCKAFVSTKYTDTETVELSLIKHPPKIVKDIEVNPSLVRLNDTAELTCTAEGYPKPNISWKRDGDQPILNSGNIYNGTVLKISDVSLEDRGIYYCIADNGIGQPDQRSIYFEVEFP